MRGSVRVPAAAAALLIGVLGTVRAEGGEYPPGLGIDEAVEKELEAALADLGRLAMVHQPDFGAAERRVAPLRKLAAALVAKAENRPAEEPAEPSLPDTAPVVLLGGTRAESVLRLWRDQFHVSITLARGLFTGETDARPNWTCTLSPRDLEVRHKRARPLAECLAEARRAALLLARKPEPVKVRKGERLFADDFAKGTGNWLLYGPAETTLTADGLRRRNQRVRNADTMMWTKKEFEGRFLVEFSFTPHKGGPEPGALFAVCGRPAKEGTDLFVSCGETTDAYHLGVRAYHFAMHDGDTGLCYGCRVGDGLKMLCATYDPASETGKRHRVAIGKWDNTLFLLVDGRLMHHYVDVGTFGPPLRGGSLGLRQWGGLDATYADVKIHRLVADGK